jgi:hypothetical protein
VGRWRRGAAAGGAVTLLGIALQSVGPLASASCDGHECDPHLADYGCLDANVAPGAACCKEGLMLDPDHWATTLQSADWIPFQSYETLRLHFAAWTGSRVPDIGLSTIDIAPAAPEGPDAPFPPNDPPDAPVDNATVASGNLGEFQYVSAGLVEVLNATCSPGIVRVVVGFPSIDAGEGGAIPAEYRGPCR